MCSIVICHILQAYDNRYCMLFNIGVHVFLGISGYLYGCKIVEGFKTWFAARFKKLYFPYILFFLICVPIYYIFAPDKINVTKVFLHIVDLQGIIAGGRISGLGHLWFMSVIAVCYVMTPLLQYFRKYPVVLPLLLVFALLEYLVVRRATAPFSWLFVYALCYLYADAGKYRKKMVELFVIILFVWTVFSISWDDILYGGALSQSLHATGGVLAVMLVRCLSCYMAFSWGSSCWKKMDKYSYEVYITHHIFILGPFSLVFLTVYPCVNIALVLLLTVLAAIGLHEVSGRIADKVLS